VASVSTPTLSCGWADPLTVAYIKIGTALVVMVAALVGHKFINLVWRRVSPDAGFPLPSILAFPRLEIAVASTTVICYSQSFGVLLSSGVSLAIGLGILALVYSALLLAVFFVLIFFLVKNRPILKADKEEQEKDLIYKLFTCCGWISKEGEQVESSKVSSKGRRRSKRDPSPLDPALMVHTLNPSFSARPKPMEPDEEDKEHAAVTEIKSFAPAPDSPNTLSHGPSSIIRHGDSQSHRTGSEQSKELSELASLSSSQNPPFVEPDRFSRGSFRRKSNKVAPTSSTLQEEMDGFESVGNSSSRRLPFQASGRDSNVSLSKIILSTSRLGGEGRDTETIAPSPEAFGIRTRPVEEEGPMSPETAEIRSRLPTLEEREPNADIAEMVPAMKRANVAPPTSRPPSRLPPSSSKRAGRPVAEAAEEAVVGVEKVLRQEITKLYYQDGVKVIEPVTKLMRTTEELRLAEEAGTLVKEGPSSKEEGSKVDEKALLEGQINDRLGSLYEEYRVINSWTVSFFYASCVANTALGVLVGVQAGAQILPTSRAAFALNIAGFVIQLIFAAYLTYIRPQIALTGYISEVAAQWLQTATMACIVALQSLPYTDGIQNAMTWIELAAIAVKVVAIYIILTTFLISYFSLRRRERKAKEELKALEAQSSPPAKELTSDVVPPVLNDNRS
jgi:preprotein translocase subunit YajC